MKVIDIAFKDMLRSARSAFTLVMMFVAPLLITGLIYVAFGGGGGGSQITVNQVQLGIVNLDAAPANMPVQLGNELVKVFSSDSLKQLIAATPFPDDATARQAILDKKISVALVIPADFTSVIFSQGGHANLAIIHDPANTLPPAIVHSIVLQVVNGFNGGSIAANVVSSQLTDSGLKADSAIISDVAQAYANWAIQNSSTQSGSSPFLTLTPPSTSGKAQSNFQVMAARIMAGMIIFFTFYTGALIAQSIIREQDDQTLARLMTTPTSVGSVLFGKLLAAMLMVGVQIFVLLTLSRFFFKITWGEPLRIFLVSLALTFLASAFGLFLMSFIKNVRQTGIVLGGVLTVLGMLGGLYTQGFTNLPQGFTTAGLFTPQGWSMQAFNIATGAVSGRLWISLVAMFAIGIISLVIGMLLFRRRFA